MHVHVHNVCCMYLFTIIITDLSLVECYESIKCSNSTLGMMTPVECCIIHSSGLAYTKSESEKCYTCIGKLAWLH